MKYNFEIKVNVWEPTIQFNMFLLIVDKKKIKKKKKKSKVIIDFKSSELL